LSGIEAVGKYFYNILFGVSALSNSIIGFMFETPEMKMDGGFESMLSLGESSRDSSVKLLNRM
jgi:hypothetical protein